MVGLGLVVGSSGSSGGLLMFVLGLVGAAVFGLLSMFSVFTSVAMLGVALGVAALTIVLAITTGFQNEFRSKVLGVHAHVIVLNSRATFAEYRGVMATAAAIDDDVLAVQPFIVAEMLVTRGKGELSGVAIKGIDPARVRGVLDLEHHMIDGSIDALGEPAAPGVPPPIILGRELAHKLKVKLGDSVTIVAPLSNLELGSWRAKSSAPRTRKFRIAGVFYSGFDDFDRRLMYASLHETQQLVGVGDQVLGVELKLSDPDRADEIARALAAKLGGSPYQVQDWYELNRNLFSALELQKLVLAVILMLIIIVAAVNMVSALTMMVADKTREIAILKSMGSSSRSVARLFKLVGVAIGGVGTLIGLALALAICAVVASRGYHLDPRIYLIDRLPIVVRWWEVAAVAGVTLVISAVATEVPARVAAALRPVDGLRHD